MFNFENSILIDKPIDQVFTFVVDLPSIPKWNYHVLSVVPTSPESGVVGSTFHQVRKGNEQDLRISELEPNKSLVVETIPPSKPELCREITVEVRRNSTLIIDKWQLDMGVPKLLEPLAANRAKSGVPENLGKLKTLLETGKAHFKTEGRSRYNCKNLECQ
ncbi:MAG: SRPBCC family protein [Anaerolineaceae bacterium]|nr:SRPBCC family protein [Anaerolineaceae bacterium]